MRYVIIFSVLSLFCSNAVSATSVSLTIDKEIVKPGEKVMLHLEIQPTRPVGGNLVIYLNEDSKYKIIKKLYDKPLPGRCYACTGDTPLNENLSEDFRFITKEVGNYRAEVNFGGVQKYVDFNVTLPMTTTTMSKITTSTIITTSITTSIAPLSTTIRTEQADGIKKSLRWRYMVPLCAFVLFVILVGRGSNFRSP